MSNINDTFFEGYYKEVWRSIIPDELTVKEIDFIISHFNLEPGSKVLDLMCGYGRHAIALAKKGMAVTAVDNLGDYTSEISKVSEKEQLPLKVMKADAITYQPDDEFDLIICMGNSLNFFNAEETTKIFDKIVSVLKPGGHLLINSWSLAEIVIKNFQQKSWSTVAGMKSLADSKFLFHPTRIETEWTFIDAAGKTENKTGVDYIYSINEMETMLNQAGLVLKEVYSIPGKKKFSLGEPRAYLVAEKM